MGSPPNRRLELNQVRRPGRWALPDGKHPHPALPPAAVRIFSIPTLRPASLLPSYISSEQGGRTILCFRTTMPRRGRQPDRFVWGFATSPVLHLAVRPGSARAWGLGETRPSAPPNTSYLAAAPWPPAHLAVAAAAGRSRPSTGPPCAMAESCRRRGRRRRTSAPSEWWEGSLRGGAVLKPKSSSQVVTWPAPPPFYETSREGVLGLYTARDARWRLPGPAVARPEGSRPDPPRGPCRPIRTLMGTLMGARRDVTGGQ